MKRDENGLTRHQRYYRRHREVVLAAAKERNAQPAIKQQVKNYQASPAYKKSNLKAQRKHSGAIDATDERKVGNCDICGEFQNPLFFDHCHQTGKHRGWLCDRCNRGLGFFRDNPVFLENASFYLKVLGHI